MYCLAAKHSCTEIFKDSTLSRKTFLSWHFFSLYYYCLSLGVMPFSSNLQHTNIKPHYLLSRKHKLFFITHIMNILFWCCSVLLSIIKHRNADNLCFLTFVLKMNFPFFFHFLHKKFCNFKNLQNIDFPKFFRDINSCLLFTSLFYT